MRPPRMIIAAFAGALVAVPGFAIAAPGGLDLLSSEPSQEIEVAETDVAACDPTEDPDCEPDEGCDDPNTIEAVEECPDEETDGDDPANGDDPAECDDPDTTDVTEECSDESTDDETAQLEDAEEQAEEVEDEGHGEAISALAQCLPGGRQLHGLGFTKGFVISQAATTGAVTLPDAEEPLDVTSPAEASVVCGAVVGMISDLAAEEAAAEGAEEDRSKAKGRPDWAGPKSDDGDEADEVDEVDEVDDADEADEAEDSEETTDTTVETTTAEVEDEDRGGPPAHAGGKGKGKGGR